MTDLRALCAELTDALDELNCGFNIPSQSALIERASAALAEPEPEGPTDEEIFELMPQQFRDDLATVSLMAAHGAGEDIKPGLFRVSLNAGALDFARAVLARWGNHPGSPDSSMLQPVPVNERLPGDQLCWWFEDDEECGYGSS